MRRFVVCLALLALTGCQDREPTGPASRLRPSFTHQTLHQGPGFYFIAPTPPGNQPVTGTFDPTLTPSVEIWQLDADGDPKLLVASLTAVVNRNPDQYQVTWSGLRELDRGPYRIEVRSAPSSGPHLFYGSVVVNLVEGGGTGLDVGGNSLPIKFWISEDAGCPPESTCETVYNAAGQTLVVVGGGAALRFEEEFCARQSATGECLEFITVIATRYRGPERCIPNPGFTTAGSPANPVASIQYELCIRVTTIPANVQFNPQKVFSYLCADLRAVPLQNAGVLRVLSVKEDANGSGIGQVVTDLTGTAIDPPTEPLALCDHDVFEGGTAAATGRLGRFAAVAQRALARAGRFLAPAPAHARRRTNVPIISSPLTFSRFGLVVPVVAEFDHDNSVGVQSQLLPAGLQPRVRVLAAETDGDRTAVPVPFVQVRFTVQGGGGSVSPALDSTNTSGYVSAAWTLGLASGNPQKLKAEVGAPAPHAGVTAIFPNGEPNGQWWTTYTFTATATSYAVYFLTPLGASGSGLTNVVLTGSATPFVRVCGPLTSTTQTGCPVAFSATARLRSNAYETSWSTGKTGTAGALYRIEVLVNGAVTGAFWAQRGGGGGGTTDPLGSAGNPYHFQSGNTIPIKFLVVSP